MKRFALPVATLLLALLGALHQPAAAALPPGIPLAWGSNLNGQLGIGSTVAYRTSPVKVPSLSGVVALGGAKMALKADGSVWAWGRNDYGQLGDGTFTDRSAPVRVKNPADASGYLTGISAIAVGGRHAMALARDHTLWVWGDNSLGQHGNGTLTLAPPYGSPTPVPVPNLPGVVAIGDGGGQSIALIHDPVTDSRTVWMWGRNSGGQLGRGTITDDTVLSNSVPAPVLTDDHGELVPLSDVVAIGGQSGRAIKGDGSVWAWGGNQHGDLGIGYASPDPIPTAVQVLGVGGIGYLAAPLAFGSGPPTAVDIAAPYMVQLQPPVNVDGTSVFKKSSTVEVRFKLTNPPPVIRDAQARFGYAQIDSTSPAAVNQPASNAAGTNGILFQYDAGSGEYRYNWRTTGLGMGRYLVRIDMGDGVARSVVVGLK